MRLARRNHVPSIHPQLCPPKAAQLRAAAGSWALVRENPHGVNGISSPLPGARIVVVDDRPDNVMVLEHLLAGWDYPNVFGTSVSKQVTELVERVDPDLVLLDLQMPQPDGFE